jgi:hypothetical protein
VSVIAYTNPDSELLANCINCCQTCWYECSTAAANSDVLAQTAADNLALDIDDLLLGPAVVLPGDSAITVMEKTCLDKFQHDLKCIELHSCSTCCEHSFVTACF